MYARRLLNRSRSRTGSGEQLTKVELKKGRKVFRVREFGGNVQSPEQTAQRGPQAGGSKELPLALLIEGEAGAQCGHAAVSGGLV
jgi:hypothetical protein